MGHRCLLRLCHQHGSGEAKRAGRLRREADRPWLGLVRACACMCVRMYDALVLVATVILDVLMSSTCAEGRRCAVSACGIRLPCAGLSAATQRVMSSSSHTEGTPAANHCHHNRSLLLE